MTPDPNPPYRSLVVRFLPCVVKYWCVPKVWMIGLQEKDSDDEEESSSEEEDEEGDTKQSKNGKFIKTYFLAFSSSTSWKL